MYGAAFLLSLGLLLFAVLDCIATDRSLSRILPKPLWILLILFLPIVGPLAWLFLGRAPRATEDPTAHRTRREHPASRPRRPLGPDDDPRFLEMMGGPARPAPPRAPKQKHDPAKPVELPNEPEARPEHGVNELKSWEKDLQRREEELRRQLGELPPEP